MCWASSTTVYLGGKKSIAIITAIKMKNDLDFDVRMYVIKTEQDGLG